MQVDGCAIVHFVDMHMSVHILLWIRFILKCRHSAVNWTFKLSFNVSVILWDLEVLCNWYILSDSFIWFVQKHMICKTMMFIYWFECTHSFRAHAILLRLFELFVMLVSQLFKLGYRHWHLFTTQNIVFGKYKLKCHSM